MSRLFHITLILAGVLNQNQAFGHNTFFKSNLNHRSIFAAFGLNYEQSNAGSYHNDTSGLRLLGPADTIYIQSVMESTKEPVTGQYQLKTTRWGDTLAAFGNTYRAVMPVPYELFMPLTMTPEYPFPHPNAQPLKDSTYPFKIVPIKNDQRMAGITTFDLALISRHVLGIQQITSPYKLIAADVNRDGSIDGTDMLFIRRLILHVDTMFRRSPHWLFIPKTYTIPEVIPPIDSIPQAYYFNAYTLDLPNPFEFVTIKMGDVNNSFHDTTTVSSTIIARKQQAPFVLTTDNLRLEKGKTYQISLKCAKKESILALQGTLTLSTEGMSLNELSNIQGGFERIESVFLQNFGEQNLNLKNKNQVAFSWNDAVDKTFYPSDEVLKVNITAQSDGFLADILKINSDLSENLVYTEGGDIRHIALKFSEPQKDFLVLQNEPNPFNAETSVKIAVNPLNGQETPTKLSVFDEMGNLLFQRSQLFDTGLHLLRLDANELGLSKAGVYYFTVESPTEKQTIKLMKTTY